MFAALLAGLGAIVVVASGNSMLLGGLVPGSVRTAAEDAGDELARIAAQRPDPSATPLATPDALLPPQALMIGATGGQGLSLRHDCVADARSAGAIPDDAAVELLEHGSGRCIGWLWVATDFGDTWVRESFVFSGTPGSGGVGVAAPPPPPAATASPTPSPSLTPAPTSTPPPGVEQVAVWFGDIAATPGDTVRPRIGGVSCENAEVLGSSLAARYFVSISSAGPCQPTAGEPVTFLVNGVPLSSTSTWQPGSTIELNLQ